MKKHKKLKKLQLFKEMITWLLARLSSFQKKYYKMIAIDLNKQQALDADPKAMEQINFSGNLN